MPGDDRIEVVGSVIEALPSLNYRVAMANGHRVIARLSSEMRLNFIQVLPGDKVVVEFSPYDLSRGRILRRSEKVTEKKKL